MLWHCDTGLQTCTKGDMAARKPQRASGQAHRTRVAWLFVSRNSVLIVLPSKTGYGRGQRPGDDCWNLAAWNIEAVNEDYTVGDLLSAQARMCDG